MNITPISQTCNFTNSTNNTSRKRINTVSWTGYAAIAAGIASGIAANKKKIKLHKNLAYIAGALSLAHIAIVEINKFKYKKLQNSK